MTKKHKNRVGGFGVRGSADPDTLAQMRDSAVRNKAALTAKQRRDRQRKRVMYDIDPTVKEVAQLLAKREDTSASQLVELLIVYGIRAYLRGDEELQEALALETRTHANTLRFNWNLHIPEEWLLALDAYLAEAQKPKKWGE